MEDTELLCSVSGNIIGAFQMRLHQCYKFSFIILALMSHYGMHAPVSLISSTYLITPI